MHRQISVRDTQLWLLQNGHLSQRMEGWTASGAARMAWSTTTRCWTAGCWSLR